ncbi:MAG: GAF domain-containing protein [Bacteroidetes bacterium]|nr:MAG: GAF domain-containing protein [Bacteroidota bacterium]
MAESLSLTAHATRAERYAELLPQIEALIGPEPDLIANLANIAAVLKEGLGFFWVGFYLRQGDELVLGPFQGPLACTRIALGRGVCGTAAAERRTVLVPDVEAFPGHIACSSLSRSEIVVPLVTEDRCELVLDVDSSELNDFSPVDAEALERLIALIARQHYRSSAR